MKRCARAHVHRAESARLGLIEKRLSEIEAKPIRYAGVWKANVSYGRGAFCTFNGGLWHCNQPSVNQRPGSSANWTLAVEAGKDKRGFPGAADGSDEPDGGNGQGATTPAPKRWPKAWRDSVSGMQNGVLMSKAC